MVYTMITVFDPDAETGWTWKLKGLPRAPETFYLQTLIAEHSFQEALKNYRDTWMLRRNLESWNKRLDDLSTSYAGRSLPDVPPTVLVKSAIEDAKAARLKNGKNDATAADDKATIGPLSLRPDTSLAERGSESAAVDAQAGLALHVADAPQFNGPLERAAQIKANIGALLPQLKDAEDAEGAWLAAVALNDLEAQRKLNEKYLIEARFALARIYDRVAKGEGDKP
jgi:hypothetical protein